MDKREEEKATILFSINSLYRQRIWPARQKTITKLSQTSNFLVFFLPFLLLNRLRSLHRNSYKISKIPMLLDRTGLLRDVARSYSTEAVKQQTDDIAEKSLNPAKKKVVSRRY